MEIWFDDTGQRIMVHDAAKCAGQACAVHNPSNHRMSGFKRHWRSDRKIIERICPHGIGHPDPDDAAFECKQAGADTVHGCDGCCAEAVDSKGAR